MSYTWRTEILFSLTDANADPHRADLVLRYTVYPGCDATHEQPAEGPTVSVQTATVFGSDRIHHAAEGWLWAAIESDEELQRELLAHAEFIDAAAAEDYADMKRDERRMA